MMTTTTAATPGTPGFAVPPRRPGALTFFGVTAIVLGSLGLLSAMSELATPGIMEMQRGMMKSMPTTPQLGDFAEMQARMTEIATRRSPLMKVLLPLGALAAVGLIVGGAGCMSRRPRGRTLLLASFGLALAVECARVSPTVEKQRELQTAMTTFFDRMMTTATPAGTPDADMIRRTMTTMTGATMSASIMFTITFMAAKAVFFGAGAICFTRPVARAHYGD